MRIGIDAHFVGVRHSGNEQYFENLIRALLHAGDPNEQYFVFSHRAAAAALLPGAGVTHVALRSSSVWWQRGIEIPRLSRRLDLDVLHVPFNFVPAARCRKIVTIHDLGFLRMPDLYAPLERHRMRVLTRMAARLADHILTGSALVKQEIVDVYGVPPGRVTVAPYGVDRTVFRCLPSDQRQAARQRLGLPDTYVLFVGVIQARKNLLVLLRALEILRARGRTDIHAVLAGRLGFKARDVLRSVEQLGLGSVVHHVGVIGADDLVALYNNASALVFPSVLEGFGLPVLEAMASGCPVVSSNVGALLEVCADAALTFDPHDPEELALRLTQVLEDADLAQRLRADGHRRAEHFTWERAAATARAVYAAA